MGCRHGSLKHNLFDTMQNISLHNHSYNAPAGRGTSASVETLKFPTINDNCMATQNLSGSINSVFRVTRY